MSQIYRVYPDNITALWPQIATLLEPALVMVSTHTSEDVRRSLMSGQAQLWAQIDDGVVEAICTSEFVNYPVGLFVRVWTAGARPDRRMDVDGFFKLMSDWCRQHDAVGFEAIGRHGWLKRCPEARVEGLVMRLILPPAHK